MSCLLGRNRGRYENRLKTSVKFHFRPCLQNVITYLDYIKPTHTLNHSKRHIDRWIITCFRQMCFSYIEKTLHHSWYNWTLFIIFNEIKYRQTYHIYIYIYMRDLCRASLVDISYTWVWVCNIRFVEQHHNSGVTIISRLPFELPRNINSSQLHCGYFKSYDPNL